MPINNKIEMTDCLHNDILDSLDGDIDEVITFLTKVKNLKRNHVYSRIYLTTEVDLIYVMGDRLETDDEYKARMVIVNKAKEKVVDKERALYLKLKKKFEKGNVS